MLIYGSFERSVVRRGFFRFSFCICARNGLFKRKIIKNNGVFGGLGLFLLLVWFCKVFVYFGFSSSVSFF